LPSSKSVNYAAVKKWYSLLKSFLALLAKLVNSLSESMPESSAPLLCNDPKDQNQSDYDEILKHPIVSLAAVASRESWSAALDKHHQGSLIELLVVFEQQLI